jgi:hypothetical protein
MDQVRGRRARTLPDREGRVFVAAQGDIDEDAVEPAVDAEEQIKEGAGKDGSVLNKEGLPKSKTRR